MAKMVGRKGMEHYHCKCCGGPEPKGIIIAREERQWRKEADDEIDGIERDHANGICSNRITGFSGCNFCYPEDEEANGPEDLELIEGVSFGESR